MPSVFFAHQAPLLPIARRWPDRVDGLTLVVGTMAPDFAYAFTGTPLQVWAHALPGLVTFCVPVTLIVSWSIARVIARVLAAHLPDLGGFHLHDYRGLATHRFRPLRATLWAFIGAVSHAALDHLGHAWGWPAQHWAAYREPLFAGTFLGRPWNVYRVVQDAGHILLTPLCVWLLFRYGRQRWFAPAATVVPEFRTSTRSHVVLWSSTALGTLLAGFLVSFQAWEGGTTILRLAGGMFIGLVLGALLARRLETSAARRLAMTGHNKVIARP
jgi:hypothetical protein